MTKSIIVNDKIFREYISREELDTIVTRLAVEINRDFAGRRPLFLVMLNGAFLFAADLLRQVTVSDEMYFVRCSSYEGLLTTGTVQLHTPIPWQIEERDVIIIEDIIDTGTTMFYFLEELEKFSPLSVTIVTLLQKPEALQCRTTIHYCGKLISNEFVVGYGLDYDGHGRTLDAIYIAGDE